MNWITRLVNKKSTKQEEVKDIPDNMWLKCPSCSSLLFKKDIKNNDYTCTSCDYYFYMPVQDRLNSIFNEGEYKILPVSKVIKDPIKFKGKEKYSEKLEEYQKKTKFEDAALAVYGKIGSNYVSCFMQNFSFMGGSMGAYVGEAFVAAANHAIKNKIPMVAFTASGGARMQEGMYSLMQMAKTTVAIQNLKNAKLPYIVVLTNPTTGGVTASFAMLGDIQIAEKSATIGFAGVRVIEQTIRKKLPTGFQTAEYLLAHGMVDLVVSRKELTSKLDKVLSLLTHNNK
ncbi:acetyl-CoA carboxylase, carboxyltransferase subunit beta [Rickettsiales bacterium LUAb2]